MPEQDRIDDNLPESARHRNSLLSECSSGDMLITIYYISAAGMVADTVLIRVLVMDINTILAAMSRITVIKNVGITIKIVLADVIKSFSTDILTESRGAITVERVGATYIDADFKTGVNTDFGRA